MIGLILSEVVYSESYFPFFFFSLKKKERYQTRLIADCSMKRRFSHACLFFNKV